MQDSIGNRMRFARESKGMTISELSAQVRIREVLVKPDELVETLASLRGEVNA